MLGLQVVILLDKVLVSLIAGYKYDILITVTETHLRADGTPSRVTHSLLGHTALLVYLPDVDGLVGFGAERGQQLVVLWTEGHGDERFMLLDLR